MEKLHHIVRQSKFRHVYGEDLGTRFEDVRPTNASSEGQLIKCNGTYLAFSWDSSSPSLALLSLTEPSRVPHDHPFLKGHSGPILDFDFNPFNDQQIVTASEDASIALWEVPEGPVREERNTPLATMLGHSKKVTLVACNPCVAYVCASASADNTMKTWSLEASSVLSTYTSPSDLCLSLHWDQQGCLLASTWRSKLVRVIDPRTTAVAVEFQGHEGGKPAKVVWGKGTETLITTGFSKFADRQVALWDLRSPAHPLTLESIDQASGSLFPFYDPDTSLLFLAGRGDGNFRYYELDSYSPYLHSIDSYKSKTPCKGLTFAPKRRVDVSSGEIMRAYKLTNATVEVVTVRVPRKAEGFQEDIYPDCVGGSPGLRVREWLDGASRTPPTVSMRDLSTVSRKGIIFHTMSSLVLKHVQATKPPTKEDPPVQPVVATTTVAAKENDRYEDVKKGLEEAEARLAAAEALISRLTAENSTLRQTLADYNLILFGSPDLP